MSLSKKLPAESEPRAIATGFPLPTGRVTVISTFFSKKNIKYSDKSPEFSGGYGFVGIAVALMGRSRSIGIVLAAILFGALYQGGAELAFDKPNITRDMIVLVQGLVILTAGALEHMFRPAVARWFAPRAGTLAQEA